MARKDTVSIYNAATEKYGVVSRFIFEHPVYGQNMVQVEDNEVPCVDCGDEVSPPEVLTSDGKIEDSDASGKKAKAEDVKPKTKPTKEESGDE